MKASHMVLAAREHLKPLRYFTQPGEVPGLNGHRPEMLRAAVITSLRDLIVEGVGRVRNEGVRERGYVKGTLEYAIEECTRGKLAHFLDIVLVIVDDTERDMAKLGNPMPLRPQREQPWVHPLNMRNREGDLIMGITRNIPSEYRLLPLSDVAGRAIAKKRFEDRVRGAMEAHDADILISDHFLCRVQHLIDPRYHNLQGRVLNTHPGISDRSHRFRTPGNTPYMHAIERALGLRGPVHEKTGASFHIIDDDIDTGPVIFDAECTPVYPDDNWPDLCARNYPLSKNRAFVEGVRHYTAHIYPQLANIDWATMEPFEAEDSPYDREAA